MSNFFAGWLTGYGKGLREGLFISYAALHNSEKELR